MCQVHWHATRLWHALQLCWQLIPILCKGKSILDSASAAATFHCHSMNLFVLHLVHWVNIPKIAGQIPWRMLCSESGNQLLPVASCHLWVASLSSGGCAFGALAGVELVLKLRLELELVCRTLNVQKMPQQPRRALYCVGRCAKKETDRESEQWHTKPNPSRRRSKQTLCGNKFQNKLWRCQAQISHTTRSFKLPQLPLCLHLPLSLLSYIFIFNFLRAGSMNRVLTPTPAKCNCRIVLPIAMENGSQVAK